MKRSSKNERFSGKALVRQSHLQLVQRGTTLQSYFASGWAFLIPYLLLYLLYAWLALPVNPPGSTELDEVVSAAAPTGRHSPGTWVPPLLHVYWGLHLVHLGIGGFAIAAWWSRFPAIAQRSVVRTTADSGYSEDHDGAAAASLRRTRGVQFSKLLRAAAPCVPWFLLALWFWIPGIYLEYPADTWEHYRRIIAWADVTQAREHYSWSKWSYYFAYTFIGAPATEGSLNRLNFFSTGVSLLLSWQYYRLARALGVGRRSSTIFVFIQTLMFGNHLFSFYRYYGISSSPFAQIGALSLVRLCVEILRPATEGGLSDSTDHKRSELGIVSVLPLSFATCSLLALTAFSHLQGLIIAGIGALAVGSSWLISLNRKAAWTLAGAVMLVNIATIAAWPRAAVLNTALREGRWLSPWYGFDLLGLTPASDRALQILGILGVLNVAASFLLIRKNHPVGWLTLAPVALLLFPAFAIPFANALAAGDPGNIVSFHRVLFAIPPGLALVVLAEQNLTATGKSHTSRRSDSKIAAVVCAVVLTVVIASPGQYTYNRFFNLVAVAPHDLSMAQLTEAAPGAPQRLTQVGPPLLVPRSIGFVLETHGFTHLLPYYRGERHISPPRVPAKELNQLLEVIRFNNERNASIKVWIPAATELWTPASMTASISSHWVPQQVALDRAGKKEVERMLSLPPYTK